MLGSVNIKVRPLKLGYLVEPNNARQVKEAIRISSSLWGGIYFPIVPLYDRMPPSWRDKPRGAPPAQNVLRGYLDAFDPDVLVQFPKEVPKAITDSGIQIITADEIWQPIEKGVLTPAFGIGIFELLEDIFDEYFKYKRKYPVKLLFPTIPRQFSLLWSSLFGELPANIKLPLEKRYAEPLDIKTIEFQPENLKEIMARDVLFPRRITQWGIEAFRRSRARGDARVFFMDVTNVADIVDFWNLRALGGAVLPLPKQFLDHIQFRELLINFLKAHRRHWRHNPKVCDYTSIIRARSSTMEEMQEFAATLKIDRNPDDPSADGFFSLQHWYPRIWDSWGRDKDGAVPNDPYTEEESSIEISETSNLAVSVKPVLPKFAFEYGLYDKARCANELSFRLYGSDDYLAEVFPKSSGENFNRAISGLTSFKDDWRVGRSGLVRLVSNGISETRDIPLAEKIMFAWLRDKGWKPTVSAPGLLAKQIFKKIGGHVGVLRDERVLGLLEHMNGGRVKQDGTPSEGNEVGQERDMSVAEVKSRLQATRGDNYGYLLSKGIFKLGLRIQCPHCLRRSWLPLENVRDSFACPRCLNTSPAVGNVDTAVWSYKTTGPFSVPNYADGAYTVLLTLDFFDDHKLTTLQSTRVVSFTAEGPSNRKLEADFALFWRQSLYGETRDGIVFGECKTYGRFQKKDFDRMRELAKMFPGAILVFSTLRKSLARQEIAGIKKIAKAGRRYWKPDHPINPVLVLTGTELLNWQRPPYCWDDAAKRRFDRVHGLPELCDATQQIYLAMPSWQADWQSEWEEKRRRQAERIATGNSTDISGA